MQELTTIIAELRKLRAEFSERLERIRRDRHHAEGPVSADFAEQATERENDEVLAQLEGSTAADLKQMDHALRRVEAGLYPLCEICGARIEMDRLRVMPFATVCGACAAKGAAPAKAGIRRKPKKAA